MTGSAPKSQDKFKTYYYIWVYPLYKETSQKYYLVSLFAVL